MERPGCWLAMSSTCLDSHCLILCDFNDIEDEVFTDKDESAGEGWGVGTSGQQDFTTEKPIYHLIRLERIAEKQGNNREKKQKKG